MRRAADGPATVMGAIGTKGAVMDAKFRPAGMVSKGFVLFLVVLVVLEYGAYLCLVPPRPSQDERFEEDLPGGQFANAIGQRGCWQVLYGAAVLIAVYWAKTAIVYRCPRQGVALACYGLVLLACLPVLWVFVTTDWNNEQAELAQWFTLPVGLLMVPTVGLFVDLKSRPYRSVRTYAIKTLVELVLIPLWLYVWVGIEFVLCFYWI